MNTWQKYAELSEEEKNEVCELLLQREKDKIPTGFICPFMGVQLNLPCSLKDCNNHIDNKWFKNCVLCYMHNEGLQQLSPTEVAFLFRIPEEEVMEIYNRQMSKIRKKYLHEELAHDMNAITYLTDVDICCVCECKTNSDIIRDGLRFCSPQCLKRRPLFIFDIEREYGCTIETVMEVAMRMFKTIEILESVFHISRKKIEFIVRNYARNLSNQFFTLISANSDFLNKKERKFIPCIKMLGMMSKRLHQFGTPKESLKSVFVEFCGKLQSI